MKYDFWANVKEGDVLFYYDTDNWKLGIFEVLKIKDKSNYDGSFILETTCKEHHYIYVHIANYLRDGYVSTWNHSTYKQIFISNDRYELIDHCKNELNKKINTLENTVFYYKNLLNDIKY